MCSILNIGSRTPRSVFLILIIVLYYLPQPLPPHQKRTFAKNLFNRELRRMAPQHYPLTYATATLNHNMMVTKWLLDEYSHAVQLGPSVAISMSTVIQYNTNRARITYTITNKISKCRTRSYISFIQALAAQSLKLSTWNRSTNLHLYLRHQWSGSNQLRLAWL